jgi:hypothetical protein
MHLAWLDVHRSGSAASGISGHYLGMANAALSSSDLAPNLAVTRDDQLLERWRR